MSEGATPIPGERPGRPGWSLGSLDARVWLSISDDVETVLLEASGPVALRQAQDEFRDRLSTSADDAALLDLDRRSWSDVSGFPSLHARERGSFFTDGRTPDGLLVALERDFTAQRSTAAGPRPARWRSAPG